MSEIVYKDQSIHEPSTLHQHPLETIPQGSQSDGVLNGHDHSDVNTGALAKSGIGILALMVFSFIVVWLMMDRMLQTVARNDAVPSHTFVERAPASVAWPIDPTDTPLQAPDEVPALMPDPETPMVELREQDKAKLKGFDYVKDEQGRNIGVTLPIERAMEKVVGELPSENLTSVKIEKVIGEPVAMGEIPYSKKVLKAEKLKEGNQSPRFMPSNTGSATSVSGSSTDNSAGGTTSMRTAPMNPKTASPSSSGNTMPAPMVGQSKTPTGQLNTRSKTGNSTDAKPNTQVGSMREKVN